MSDDHKRKAARVTEDRFASVIHAYINSPKFRAYAPATQALWGRELLYMAREVHLGTYRITEIRPALMQAYFDGIEGKAYKQAAALAAVKQLEKWAIVRDILPRQITLGVEIDETDEGHIPWPAELVELAERHARPDLAPAVTLGANTGQRGSDLVRMGPTDVEVYDGREGINVRQKKTGRVVWVPILSPLAVAIATWERRPGPWLRHLDGSPWTRRELTDAWRRERDENPALEPLRRCGPDKDKPLVLHGLRGHACVRLLHAGANTRQIADMVGMSEVVVAKYTRFSVQRENASAAVIHMERTIQERDQKKVDKARNSGKLTN